MEKSKYDTGINILGSIPDYVEMINYIISLDTNEHDGVFSFRTTHSTERFKVAITSYLLQFSCPQHKSVVLHALAEEQLSIQNKLMIIFWQLTYTNLLFRRITEEVFMKAVFMGRNTIDAGEIVSFLHYIKEVDNVGASWSDSTLKTIGSKYLTLMKKLGLADGIVKKHIRHPLIGNDLFVWFIRWCQLVYPSDKTLNNPYIQFGFMDKDTIINRLKKIENVPYWDIYQIGNDATIDLKPYE
jgi:hypothetical protein